MGLAVPAAVPSLDHEAPLAVLREDPSLVPRLLRESCGLVLPAYTTVEVGDTGFNQPVPVERRADLVLHLRDGPPDHGPVMGIVVEVQRGRDEHKRRSWPMYVASLHARLRCPTCLVVIAVDDAIARWAATPIVTLQPGSPFAPLVLGADHVPRLAHERALREPWLAVLSGLVHGNRAGGTEVTLTSFAALDALSIPLARTCYDLLRSSLSEPARRALEEAMLTLSGKYEYQSEFARRYFSEGRQEGRLEEARDLVLALADRHGDVSNELRGRVTACTAHDELRTLAVELAGATDLATVESLLARLTPATAEPG